MNIFVSYVYIFFMEYRSLFLLMYMYVKIYIYNISYIYVYSVFIYLLRVLHVFMRCLLDGGVDLLKCYAAYIYETFEKQVTRSKRLKERKTVKELGIHYESLVKVITSIFCFCTTWLWSLQFFIRKKRRKKQRQLGGIINNIFGSSFMLRDMRDF